MIDQRKFTESFLGRVSDTRDFLRLFDFLPDAFLYIKDKRSRFVKVNQSLLKLHGMNDESEIIGKTDLVLTNMPVESRCSAGLSSAPKAHTAKNINIHTLMLPLPPPQNSLHPDGETPKP